MWTQPETSYDGRYYKLSRANCDPKPLQQPHPPIWIGGNSDRAIRRTVELADGWNPMPSPARASKLLRTPPIESIADLERRIGDLRAASEKAGRADVPEVIFTPIGVDMFRGELPSAQAFVDDMGALAAIGVSTVTVNLPGATRAEWIDNMAWLGADVIAKVS
jgi:hypothetical protein